MWLSLGVSYWITLALAIPAGGLLVRMFIFQHDCSHGSFFRAGWANHLVGATLGVLTLTPYQDWRRAHALHHATHGDLDHRGFGDVDVLTVEEYQKLNWRGRLRYRLYRNPLVMFGLFPTLLFLVRFRTTHRLPRDWRHERASVIGTDIALAIGLTGIVLLGGLKLLLLLYLPAFVVSATAGLWLFYVQHQFDPTYWQRHEQWDRVHAGLRGSSYYRLPKVLQWFTGNIGLHHIHHLDSRIPNYRLQQCLDENREFLDIPPLTLRASLGCARLKLWDEQAGRMVGFEAARQRRLDVIYILCSSYDDDGYARRFRRGILPSNTANCLRSLTEAVDAGRELGPDVRVRVHAYDDTVQRIPIRRIMRRQRRGRRVLVGLVGVQSGQFARATDIALALRDGGVPVMIGGFHVSGMLATMGRPTGELQKLLDRGVTLVRGEAEAPGALAGILRDALADRLQPLYEMPAHPDLADAPLPRTTRRYRRRFFSRQMVTLDTSRGCPFNCSFCTVINVLGHRMRCRSADRILATIETNYDQGIRTYFFVDDNLARSSIWESLFDGLIDMRRRGRAVEFMMQVDTQATRIPRFVDKARQAGCYNVFIGMESLDAANLAAIGKRQNHVGEYARMVQAWRDAGVIVQVGYIIGLPHDTPERVDAAVESLMNDVRVDLASFFMLTPLPGSADHAAMVRDGVPIDADLNNFDTLHSTFRHANMTGQQWRDASRRTWDRFYSIPNITRILSRVQPVRYWDLFWQLLYHRHSALAGVHPMFNGLGRRKSRRERRAGYPREGLLRFAWGRVRERARTLRIYAKLFFEFQEIWLRTRPRDSRRQDAAVARRRRLSLYWSRLGHELRRGRLWLKELVFAPAALLLEVTWGIRFARALRRRV
ncbi:MAG: hypothetical protein BIFFINMI_04117 [Phycisphaerae bacterium]|nr:hypothetical protein [Phycisphaerae bacterium]